MVQALAQRERRPLWVAFSLVFAIAVGVSVWAAIQARGEAIREAGIDAELTAQSELAPLLQPEDLVAPVVGERAAELAADVRGSITSAGPIADVRIYSSLGRILYASDPAFVGARPSYMRDVTVEVAGGETQTRLRNGLLQTYVPIWLNPGGAVAVAEVTQPFGPIAARATGGWYLTAVVAGGLMLACLAMVIVTTSAGAPRPMSRPLYQPMFPRRMGGPQPHLYEHPAFRAIEEQRHDVQRRAEAAEDNFRSVQHQLKETLAQIKQLEGRLAMNETQASTNDGDLRALRDQLRETAERLHQAELDNHALRERMAVRQQELDEARHYLVTSGANDESVELRSRLEEAELRTAEMAHEIERLEAELDYTNQKFHMTKLSEALREFDNDDIEIQERDDFDKPPVIIRNGSGQSKTRAAG